MFRLSNLNISKLERQLNTMEWQIINQMLEDGSRKGLYKEALNEVLEIYRSKMKNNAITIAEFQRALKMNKQFIEDVIHSASNSTNKKKEENAPPKSPIASP